MPRLVPFPVPVAAPPSARPVCDSLHPQANGLRDIDCLMAEECLARGAAHGTATGAFEALMDWVEGRT